jgi:STE24 endopeptidase
MLLMAAADVARQTLEIVVTPEMQLHSRLTYILYFAETAALFAVLVAFLTGGMASRIRTWLDRYLRSDFMADLGWFILFAAIGTAVRLPLLWVGGWLVPHHFDLSSQSVGGWALDELKGFALFVAVGAPAAAGVLFAIRRFGRLWWLLAWLVFIPVATALVMIQPLVADPLFNDFKPLRDAGLREAIEREADAAGLRQASIWEVDKSRQTHEMNAYVNGLGPTARIVIWDTLLQKMSRDEILFIVGHELGHDRLHHIWKGLFFTWGLAFIIFLLIARIGRWGIGRFGEGWRIQSMADRASVVWLMFILVALLFLSTPMISAFSRHQEHSADLYALRLTSLGEAGASSFIKFAVDSKVDPDPPRFLVLWAWSHPPLADRVQLCRQWPTSHVSSSRSGYNPSIPASAR